MHLNVKPELLREVEDAISYNSSSTFSHAESMIMDLLKILIEGGIVTIEDDNVELWSIEDYKNWKKDKEYLSFLNTDTLVRRITKSVFTVSKNEIEKIENSIHYNVAASVKSAESALIRIFQNLIISEPVLIEETGQTLSSIADYNLWIKGKAFENYDSKKLIALMKNND